jgi:hypothetical protein
LCTIFHFLFQVSRHVPCPTRWFSHFLSWSVFLPFSRSYSLHFSFLHISMILAIFYVLPCVCLIFHVFQFSPHNPNLKCTFLIFHLIQCFSPYSRLYNVCDAFSTVFFLCLFFRHIPDPKVSISRFLCFSMFLFHIYCSKVCVSQFPRFFNILAKFYS